MPTHTRLLVLVPVGFFIALGAAGLIAAIGLVGAGQSANSVGFVLFAAKWMAIFAGLFAFIPWVIAVILAALFGFRSVLYWLAVGGGIGAAGYALGELPGDWPSNGYAIAIHLSAGFVGGFLYWLIAGRDVRFVPRDHQALG